MSFLERNANPAQLWFADFPELILDARQFSIIERISGLFEIHVEAWSPHANLPFDALVDRGAALTLHYEGEGSEYRLWSGICAQVMHKSSAPSQKGVGRSLYQVTIVPELWRLSLNKNSRIFQDRSIPEIVVEVLNDWGIEPIVRNFKVNDIAQFPKFEYRVQYEESDYALINRLMAEAGITHHFAFTNEASGPARDTTVLVLDTEPGKASTKGGAEDAKNKPLRWFPYRGHTRAEVAFDEDVVINAGTRRALRPGAVTLIDHEFRSELGGRAGAYATVSSDEKVYEQFAYVPGGMQSNGKTGDAFNQALAKDTATRELERLRSDVTVSTFLTNALEVCPGTVVQFGGDLEHDRAELSGATKHLVVATTLHGDTKGTWWTQCTAVPAEAPFYPRAESAKPRIDGLQSALVVGPDRADPEEICCDEFGRVKVQFHWDRQHLYGEAVEDGPELATRWVRVGSMWAGSAYGFVGVPRVGHEVLVAYLDGDPDEPVVVGTAHNQFNPAPYPLPAEKRKTGLRTNSSLGGNGFNEIYFDDSAASVIHMQAQRNLSTVVKSSETLDVHGSRTTRISPSDVLHVADEWRLAVGQHDTGMKVNKNDVVVVQVNGAKGAQWSLMGTGMFLNAMSDIHMHAGNDIHFSAIGKIDIQSGPPATCKVDINAPDREPVPVELPSYVAANRPLPGGTVDPGGKGRGGGGMPEPPGQLADDVVFPKPEEEDPEPEGETPEERGNEGNGFERG